MTNLLDLLNTMKLVLVRFIDNVFMHNQPCNVSSSLFTVSLSEYKLLVSLANKTYLNLLETFTKSAICSLEDTVVAR